MLDAVIIVVLGEYIMWRALGLPERFLDQPATLIFNAGWAATPFALIWSFHKSLDKCGNLLLSSAAGLALTFAGWAWYYRGVYIHHTTNAASATDIGLGLLMLLLPAIVFAVMLFIALVTRLRGN